MDIIPKTVLTSRLDDALHMQLSIEAKEKGQTLSSYAKTLLLRRGDMHGDIELLRNKILLLEAENNGLRGQPEKNGSTPVAPDKDNLVLKSQNQQLKNSILELVKQNKALQQANPAVLPFDLDRAGHKACGELLDHLKELYPDSNPASLLLASLEWTLQRHENFLFDPFKKILNKYGRNLGHNLKNQNK